MVSVTRAMRPNYRESIVGRPASDLVLRVCGAEHDGRLVRITSPKCTIGSSRNCTLRLKARGIAPLQCLIVRGVHGAAVRRWSRETRLNGGAFFDAPLRIGDRLGMGPLELEVVEGPPPGGASEGDGNHPSPAEFADLCLRLAELERQLDERERTLREERGHREQLQQRVEEGARAWEAEKAELERRVQQAEATLQQAQERAAHWEAAAANRLPLEVVDEQRLTWERRIAELQRELGDARAHAWDEERRVLEEQLRRAQAARREAVEQAEHWERIAAERAAATPTGESDEVWRQRITELRREFEQSRESLETQRNELERQLTLIRAELAEKETHLAEKGNREQEPSAEESPLRAAWEAERNELEARLHAAEEALEKSEENTAEWKRVAAQRIDPEELAAARREWEQTLNQLRGELEEARRRQPSFDPVAEGETRTESAGLSETPPWEENGFTATLVLPRVSPTAAAPAEAESEFSSTLVLPRREEVPAREAPVGLTYAAAESMFSPVVQSVASESTEAAEEDESIEAYMARLLQRVRGEDAALPYRSAPPAARIPPAPVAPPKPSVKSSPPPPSSSAATGGLASILGASAAKGAAAPAKIKPEDFVPRSQPPERSERLAAMRDLANTSARTAIGRYTQGVWLSSAVSKLALSAGAAGAAVFLGLFAQGHPVLVYGGAGVSGVSSVMWFGQSLRYTKNFFRARREQRKQAQREIVATNDQGEAAADPST